MESLRFVVALKVHCSKQCKEILDRLGGYHLQERGLVEMKVHSLGYTYWHECFAFSIDIVEHIVLLKQLR